MEKREYIKVVEPSSPMPTNTNHLKDLNDNFWKEWVFYYLLDFYKNHSKLELQTIIKEEQTRKHPRPEREITKYIRKYLRDNIKFSLRGFKVFGEVTNDEDVEGNYDITLIHSYWENEFYFECKNLSLDSKKSHIDKYVYTKIYPKNKPPKRDGGVYRYFNGKYAQNQNFGGLLGFVLADDIKSIKDRIIQKLDNQFDTSPDGDLRQIINNSILANDFTFDSIHSRFNKDFTLHHLLFELNKN